MQEIRGRIEQAHNEFQSIRDVSAHGNTSISTSSSYYMGGNIYIRFRNIEIKSLA